MLGSLAFGDVLIDGDEIGDLAALIAHGGDRHLFCVEVAVLVAIDQFSPPDTTGGDGSPKPAIEAGVVLARLENAWSFPNDLFRRPARQGTERRIDPQNDAVRIGNEDTVGGSRERRTLEAQLFLRPFAFGDVPDRCLVKHFPVVLHSGQEHIGGELLAADPCVRPLEEMSALTHGRLNHFPGFLGGIAPVRLPLGRQFPWRERKQLLLVLRPEHLHSGQVYGDELPGRGLVDHEGITGAFEETPVLCLAFRTHGWGQLLRGRLRIHLERFKGQVACQRGTILRRVYR